MILILLLILLKKLHKINNLLHIFNIVFCIIYDIIYLGEYINTDTRVRYFFSIFQNDSIIWEGYLLHDEAWSLLKHTSTISYNPNNTQLKSSNIEELFKKLNINKFY